MRYPVMNLSGRYRMGQGPSASFGALKDTATQFKNAIDSNAPGSGSDSNNLAQQFNNQMDQAIQNGESPTLLFDDLEKSGIPMAYLRNMRPDLFTDPFTNVYYGSQRVQPPPGTTRPGEPISGGGTNPYQPQGVKANQPTATEGGVQSPYNSMEEAIAAAQKAQQEYEAQQQAQAQGQGEEYSGPSVPPTGPAYSPVATGGSSGNAHNYEEQAAEYSQKLREFQEAQQKSQEEADAQIKASNAARDAAEQALKAKYESGNPNAVCSDDEWWDGRSCRSKSMNRAGGLVNQAMNLGPSGGMTQMVTPGNLDVNPGNLSLMGRRYRIVNL